MNEWFFLLFSASVFCRKYFLLVSISGVNKNTPKSLNELEKAVETLACNYHSLKGALQSTWLRKVKPLKLTDFYICKPLCNGLAVLKITSPVHLSFTKSVLIDYACTGLWYRLRMSGTFFSNYSVVRGKKSENYSQFTLPSIVGTFSTESFHGDGDVGGRKRLGRGRRCSR